MNKLSINNANNPAPKLWRKIENVLLIILIPAIVLVLTNWGFKDEVFLNRLLLLINVLLVAIVKGIGLFLADEEQKPELFADDGEEEPIRGGGTKND